MRKSVLGLLLAAAVLVAGAVPAWAAELHRMDRTGGRDDGVWLFPLAEEYWEKFSDWAGCVGNSVCGLCGRRHTREYDPISGRWLSWGDKWHGNQATAGHNGIDLAAPKGTAVLSAAAGRVVHTASMGARGKTLITEHPIAHSGYSYYACYQHLDQFLTAPGDEVAAGAVIARVGNTGGNGYGDHLHFGIVMAPSGTDIARELGAVESQGWITWQGFARGRILNNPSVRQESLPTTSDLDGAVLAPLAYHSGSVEYTFDPSQVRLPGDPVPGEETDPVEATDVRPVDCPVLAADKQVVFHGYARADEAGNDTYYLKLRDVARALDGTAAQFDVGWDGSAITITTQTPYAGPAEQETADPPKAASLTLAASQVAVDGRKLELEAVLVQDSQGSGHTYFKLRDLGELVGFAVDWNETDGVVIQAN